jgi:hypothetical protein
MYALYRTPSLGSSFFVNGVNTFGRLGGFADLVQLLCTPATGTDAGAGGSATAANVAALSIGALELLQQVHELGRVHACEGRG